MADPTRFEITCHGRIWWLARDGRRLGDYSHADRAVHDAVTLARGMEQTGQPAAVLLYTGDGRVIEVTTGPERSRNADDERSAIVPSRSPSG